MIDVFSQRILELRKKKKLTQEKMAAELGITRQSLSNYEKGERIPDIEILRVICEKMDCSPNYLLGFQDTIKDCDHSITEETGLSELAVNNLRQIKRFAKITSRILETAYFEWILNLLNEIIEELKPGEEDGIDILDLIGKDVDRIHGAHKKDRFVDYVKVNRYECNIIFENMMDYVIYKESEDLHS